MLMSQRKPTYFMGSLTYLLGVTKGNCKCWVRLGKKFKIQLSNGRNIRRKRENQNFGGTESLLSGVTN